MDLEAANRVRRILRTAVGDQPTHRKGGPSMPTQAIKALAAAVVLTLAAAVLPAVADNYQKGIQKFERRSYGSAAQYFKRALQQNPKNVDAWVFLGDCYVFREEHAQAVQAYEKAAELRPEDPQIRYKLGVTHDLSFNVDKAFKEYKILKKLDPQLAQKLYEQIFRD
jgi:cytochrome c-type biogenesis protein CcmH/NrfG